MARRFVCVLSDDDRALAQKNLTASEERLKPAAARAVKAARVGHVDRLVSKGVPRQAAERAASRIYDAGVLSGSDLITLDDGSQLGLGDADGYGRGLRWEALPRSR